MEKDKHALAKRKQQGLGWRAPYAAGVNTVTLGVSSGQVVGRSCFNGGGRRGVRGGGGVGDGGEEGGHGEPASAVEPLLMQWRLSSPSGGEIPLVSLVTGPAFGQREEAEATRVHTPANDGSVCSEGGGRSGASGRAEPSSRDAFRSVECTLPMRSEDQIHQEVLGARGSSTQRSDLGDHLSWQG